MIPVTGSIRIGTSNGEKAAPYGQFLSPQLMGSREESVFPAINLPPLTMERLVYLCTQAIDSHGLRRAGIYQPWHNSESEELQYWLKIGKQRAFQSRIPVNRLQLP